MTKTFEITVEDWVAKSKEVTDAIIKESTQRIVNEIRTPRARGGNMPVDTGFLRASVTVQINTLSAPVTMNPNRKMKHPDSTQWVINLAQAEAGDIIFVAFTANYAVFMEARYGFVRLGIQNFQQHVNAATQELKARFQL